MPSALAYWRATPTEAEPFFGSAVSSTTSTASRPPTSASALAASTASSGAPSQAGLATKLWSWSCLAPDAQDRARFLAYLREEDAVWRARVQRLGIGLDE